LQIDFSRGANCFAGADVELAAMQRALDDRIVEPAVGQQRVGMAADIIRCKDIAADVVEPELHSASLALPLPIPEGERQAFFHDNARALYGVYGVRA